MSSLSDLAERMDPPSSRLKRLSLVPKSPPVLSESRSAANVNTLHRIPERHGCPSTPRRDASKRSSIIYSPRPSSATGSFELPTPRSAVSRTSGESSRIEEAEGGKGKEKERRAETLIDRHADLLTMIAEKERRVNELKQELAQQEAALSQLKSKWVQIASRQPPPTQSSSTITRIRPTLQTHPLTTGPSKRGSMSISSLSSTSSASTLTAEESAAVSTPQQTHSLDASIAHLFSQIQTEGIGGEALEGGKRFFGQLVKTVSAAASGTIPGAEGEGHGPFDLSGLKGIIPAGLPSWSEGAEDPRPAARPARPSNSARLNRSMAKKPSQSSSSGGSLLPSPIEEDLLGDEAGSSSKIMTPRKKQAVKADPRHEDAGGSESVKGAKDNDEDDGWGW